MTTPLFERFKASLRATNTHGPDALDLEALDALEGAEHDKADQLLAARLLACEEDLVDSFIAKQKCVLDDRRAVAASLWRLGDSAPDHMFRGLLLDPGASVGDRTYAARALHLRRTPACEAILEEALDEPCVRVRRAVHKALLSRFMVAQAPAPPGSALHKAEHQLWSDDPAAIEAGAVALRHILARLRRGDNDALKEGSYVHGPRSPSKQPRSPRKLSADA
jgi:hypothetical protein